MTRRSKTSTRLSYAAAVETDSKPGRYVLRVRRGAGKRVVDAEGAEVETKRDPLATLFTNLGDLHVVSAADLASDRIAMVEVVSMTQGGTPIVAVLAGVMPIGEVVVQPGRKVKLAARRKAA